MKNKISIILVSSLLSAITAFGQLDLSELSMTASFDFESQYVFRGKDLADASFQPSVELEVGGFYSGIWLNEPTDDVRGASNEVDIYFGYTVNVEDSYNVDVGVTYYWYPTAATVSRSREIYAGIALEHDYNPALYIYYDFDLEQITLELSAGYSFDISDQVANSSIDVKGYWGLLQTDDKNAGQMATTVENGYTYLGFSVDYVYSFNDTSSLSTGIRYGGNNDGVINGREDSFWWGVSFSSGF